ncbi:MAG: acylphosphatase [bacterium]|nr:acylphosphatase [bacterium]
MGSINKALVRNHIFIEGKVQGINFREEMKKRADKWGVEGIAKNLLNGQVEIILEGERAKVLKVADWIGKGPVLARIKRLDYKWEVYTREFKGKGFQIG